ncbi:MAG: SDR family NAD(P)-dependent oxidoreductase [Clostridia bacterium]|nr:SDR family NAD(P)-dependent oxidoreductase [Clostridia bacterium]
MDYTLITGACGGLGRAFCHELAAKNERLFLTGRNEEKLTKLKEELQAVFGVSAIVFSADLTKEEDRKALFLFMETEGIFLCRLVNAAGADIQKPVLEYTQEKIAFQCRVNFEAAVSLCQMAVKRKAKTLEIINVSSVSGIYPMPYFAIYSATKRALTNFSIAFREEMKGLGVSVTAILPGAMPTREDIKEQIKGQGIWGRLAAKTPEFVAKKSLLAAAKNKRVYIPGFWNKMMNFATKLLPLSWKLAFIKKRWSKISKDAF